MLGSVAITTMPSPAAKLKSARRLPKRLRISGEEPQGDIARMREEAAARYERGESSCSTLHSCLQRPRTDRTDENHDWWAGNTWSWNTGWGSTWHGNTGWQHSAQVAGSTVYEKDNEGSSWSWTSPRASAAARKQSPGRPLPPKPPAPRRHQPAQVWRAKAGERQRRARFIELPLLRSKWTCRDSSAPALAIVITREIQLYQKTAARPPRPPL